MVTGSSATVPIVHPARLEVAKPKAAKIMAANPARTLIGSTTPPSNRQTIRHGRTERKRGVTRRRLRSRASGRRLTRYGFTGPLKRLATAEPHTSVPWQCLNFLPEPQGHMALREVRSQPVGKADGGKRSA